MNNSNSLMNNQTYINSNLPLLQGLIAISKDIFSQLGTGYNEVVYHNAFEVELRSNPAMKALGVQYQREVITPVIYKGFNIGHGRIDLLVTDSNSKSMIIELKAITTFNNESANIQIKNYMKHFSIKEGLIINFGQPNKTNPNGELGIKYILNDPIAGGTFKHFTFVNDVFVEYPISGNSEMNIS